MDGLVSNAAMILLSLHPPPASETSAFNKIRAFSSRWAGLFPFRIRTSSCSRSSPLNRTTYFFTEISFAAMIRLRRRIVDKANHQILTNWLKRATSDNPILTAHAGDLWGCVALRPFADVLAIAAAELIPLAVDVVDDVALFRAFCLDGASRHFSNFSRNEGYATFKGAARCGHCRH